MITYICGKPGGGKSISAIREMVAEMENPSGRFIVTNLPLVLSEWWERFGIEACEKRIRILGDEEISQFYLARIGTQGSFDLPIVSLTGLSYEVPDLSFSALDTSCERGILYVIDEVHIHFHARQWQRVGMATQFWATQHRKVNDRVLLLTQKIEQVEKQVRNLGQEYWLCSNLSTQKAALSWVSHSRRVKVLKFLNATGTDKQPDGFEFDPKPFFGLYDTSGGVGVQGRGHGETDGKKRGINIRIVIPAAILLLAGLVGFLVMVMRHAGQAALLQLPTQEGLQSTIAEGISDIDLGIDPGKGDSAQGVPLRDLVPGESVGGVSANPVRLLTPFQMSVEKGIMDQQAELQRYRNQFKHLYEEKTESPETERPENESSEIEGNGLVHL